MVLACDQDLDKIVCCGWPESIANASDCTMVKAATTDERIQMLRQVAKSCDGQYRGNLARRQLETLTPEKA